MRVSSFVDLPCSLEEAWAVLTGWERQADWIADADRIDVVSDVRVGTGVRLDVHTRLFQVPAFTETMEIVAWDPPRRLEIVHGAPVAGRGAWMLEPIDGGTRFTWTEDVELDVPVIGTIAAAVYGPIARSLIGRSQRALRALIIASGPGHR